MMLIAAGMLFAVPGTASAYTAGNMTPVGLGYGDVVYNYDFDGTRSQSYRTVDWPVNVWLYNNASVSKMKSALGNKWDQTGGNKFSYLTDGDNHPGYQYNEDDGRKWHKCTFRGDYTAHYRVYADDNGAFYNLTYGYYAFATSHFDIQECTTGPTFGYSETAEAEVIKDLRNAGYYTESNSYTFYNYRYGTEGNHIWRSNGYISRARF